MRPAVTIFGKHLSRALKFFSGFAWFFYINYFLIQKLHQYFFMIALICLHALSSPRVTPSDLDVPFRVLGYSDS